jgi:hypothetical protein
VTLLLISRNQIELNNDHPDHGGSGAAGIRFELCRAGDDAVAFFLRTQQTCQSPFGVTSDW